MDCQKLYDNNEIAKGEKQSLRMKYPFIDELELKNCNLSLENKNLKDENSKLKDENKKLKEECGAMDVIEKLNQEFDDLQNINQKLVEEIELKAETIKEQNEELKILSMYLSCKECGSYVVDLINWFYQNSNYLRKKGVLEFEAWPFEKEINDWYTRIQAEEAALPSELLQQMAWDLETQFEEYCEENITSSYF